jgi:hypothetical protein
MWIVLAPEFPVVGSSAREKVLISLLDTDHVSRIEEMPKLSLFQDTCTGSWISCLTAVK